MQASEFMRREAEGIVYYSCTHFESLPLVRHGFSTRHGGVSSLPARSLNLSPVSWDLPELVAENRRRFLGALRIHPDSLATVSQIHSGEFHIIKTRAHQWNPRTRGDALVTAEAGVALAVLVADCFPLLIADPQTGAIAAVHSGWRGTLAGVLTRTLAGMHRDLGVDPSGVWVAIGPGIRNCCLEVGAEVATAFHNTFVAAGVCEPHPAHAEKFLLDLPQALNLQLAQAGVPREHVFDLKLCTRCCRSDFFSYRAEGNQSGRMMAVICRDSS